MFKNQFGPQNYIYKRPGLLGGVIKIIPAPIKVFGCISLAAAATVVLAPVVFILGVPPLVCGAWLLHRRNKHLSSVLNTMHNQRWNDMASFHIQEAPLSASSQNIPTIAKILVEKGLVNNEKGLASQIGFKNLQSVKFGPLLSLAQDFRIGPTGGSEQMSVSEYPLLVGRKTRGMVRIVVRQDDRNLNMGFISRVRQSASTKKKAEKMRVEVQLNDGELFVLSQSVKGSEEIIEGHGHQVK